MQEEEYLECEDLPAQEDYFECDGADMHGGGGGRFDYDVAAAEEYWVCKRTPACSPHLSFTPTPTQPHLHGSGEVAVAVAC